MLIATYFVLQDVTTEGNHGRKSLLNPEDEGLVLKGRQLHILPALKKEEMENLRTSDQKHNKIKDKRNIYLMDEGAVQPGTPAAHGLSKLDIKRREDAEREKRAKLKNPNYIVSSTRLCFRNLPLSVDEKNLKEIIKKALAERMLQEDCPETTMTNFKSKITVRQVKIARSQDRVDSTGLLRSKGYAFVEFSEHAHALACLHQLNNNPKVFGDKKRPIIEFAIDNAIILKKREERNKKMASRQNPMDRTIQKGKPQGTIISEKRLSKPNENFAKRSSSSSSKPKTVNIKSDVVHEKIMKNQEHEPKKKVKIIKVKISYPARPLMIKQLS